MLYEKNYTTLQSLHAFPRAFYACIMQLKRAANAIQSCLLMFNGRLHLSYCEFLKRTKNCRLALRTTILTFLTMNLIFFGYVDIVEKRRHRTIN